MHVCDAALTEAPAPLAAVLAQHLERGLLNLLGPRPPGPKLQDKARPPNMVASWLTVFKSAARCYQTRA